MGRRCISRFVQGTPAVKGFRPFGRLAGQRQKVLLSLDEYEAIRLLDHEDLTQEEAARRMQVSRPTLTRIYDRARKKFASALIEGRVLLIEGGDITLSKHFWLCEECGDTCESGETSTSQCPSCQSPRLVSLDGCYRQQCGQCGKCRHRHGNGRSRRNTGIGGESS